MSANNILEVHPEKIFGVSERGRISDSMRVHHVLSIAAHLERVSRWGIYDGEICPNFPGSYTRATPHAAYRGTTRAESDMNGDSSCRLL
jgi:hypothetical protein